MTKSYCLSVLAEVRDDSSPNCSDSVQMTVQIVVHIHVQILFNKVRFGSLQHQVQEGIGVYHGIKREQIFP
jgi:hypothetical protein